MDYWPTNPKKRKFNKNMSIEYKKSIFNSENNDNEQKSKNTSINKQSLNLFKGIVKITKRTLKEKKSPEAQSNIVNNDNNIFDFTNFVYNNEEHLDVDKFSIIKSPKNNNTIRNDNIISLSPTLRSKRTFNKNKSALELLDLSKNIYKEKNLKKSLFNKNSKRISLNYNNSIIKTKPRRRSLIGDMTNKNRNSHNFNFFFKLKEKDKIPSKTPYLDKIWNTANKLNFKHKTNIHTKQNPGVSLVKRKTQEFNMNRITKINIKSEKEKEDESPKKSKDKSEKEKSKDSVDKKQEEKMEENETKVIDKKDKNIFSEEKIKKTNMNIIFNILNKPFFCCLK